MAVTAGIGHWIASDPPDPAFHEVYTPYHYQLPPLTRSDSVPEPYAAAVDASLRNQLEIVSLSTAVLVSVERYQGATIAGDQAAANRQLLAFMNYTNQVAKRFEDGARLLENLVAVRRTSPGVTNVVLTADQIRAAQQQLASNGPSEAMLAVFAWLGVSQEFLSQQVLPALLSVNPNEAAGSYDDKVLEQAAIYRWAGAGLTRKVQATYMVGNPHDKEETINLFIRPVSIPPDWKLSIVDTEQQAKFKVKEIEPGKHYTVTLPPKAEIEVTSMVVPVSEVGANTTARWAVEGKIGNELIGGMVHEMNVPHIIADLKLPLVGSKEVEEMQPPPARRMALGVIIAVGAGVLILLVFAFLIIKRRRRTKAAP
jgi:hypothetical protein